MVRSSTLFYLFFQGSLMREEPAGRFWGDPGYGPWSDTAESYVDQLDYDNQQSDMDSAESYDPCTNYTEGWTEVGERGEYRDFGLQSEMGSNCEKDSLMEVEEVPYGDPAPTAPPKAPPRARRPRASKLPRVTGREAASSSEEDTPLPEARGPKAHVPTPKPCGGKKAATPVPALVPGNMAGALLGVHTPKLGQLSLPKPAKAGLPQAGQPPNQPMTGGLAAAPSAFPGLFNTDVRMGGIVVTNTWDVSVNKHLKPYPIFQTLCVRRNKMCVGYRSMVVVALLTEEPC
ncbi:hypothetical protein P4O66_003330 [Electrophorus voltai]|uniref:Uncharacterized protein n=1 Tax=Electrophorus voltai TaxID=2609070 RepID=A0AAD8YP84_9TELE|nr:hypothetical protein P4O66_003330 [Electrophorus voltai]